MQVSWYPDGNKLLFISDRGDNIISKHNKDILSVFATDFNNQDIYSIDATNHISRYTNTSYN